MTEITREQSEAEIAELQSAMRRAMDSTNTEARIMALRDALDHPCAAHEFNIPGLHEDLAMSLRRVGNYDEAIREMRLAIEAGYRSWPVPEVEIAELHLLAGRADVTRQMFADIRERTPDDVWLYNAAGYAYAQAGDHEASVAWFTDGIELAMSTGDPEGIVAQMDDGRTASLKALGSEPDELTARATTFVDSWTAPFDRKRPDYLGEPPEPPLPCDHCGWQSPEDTEGLHLFGEIADMLDQLDDHPPSVDRHPVPAGVAMAWFPVDQWAIARAHWSELQDLGLPVDHREYSRHMQGRLLALAKAGIGKIHVAPLTVDGLTRFATEHEVDPGMGDTRASYAAELLRTGTAIAWPPGRNDPCWCGSGRKYKACCLTAPIKEN